MTLEPLRTQAFQLNYAKAEDIMKQIAANQALANQQSGGGNSNRILSPRGAVIFDDAHEPGLRDRHPVQARGGGDAVIARIDIRCAR